MPKSFKYTLFAARNGPQPVVRYHKDPFVFISLCELRSSSNKVVSKKNFIEQWLVPNCEQGILAFSLQILRCIIWSGGPMDGGMPMHGGDFDGPPGFLSGPPPPDQQQQLLSQRSSPEFISSQLLGS